MTDLQADRERTELKNNNEGGEIPGSKVNWTANLSSPYWLCNFGKVNDLSEPLLFHLKTGDSISVTEL